VHKNYGSDIFNQSDVRMLASQTPNTRRLLYNVNYEKENMVWLGVMS